MLPLVDDKEYKRTTGLAIEIMTAMFAESGNTDFAMARLRAMVDERGEQAYEDACAGLINLAAMILLDVHQNTGTDELEQVQRYGLAVQSLKPRPPEEPT
jgi:hypothetical protein